MASQPTCIKHTGNELEQFCRCHKVCICSICATSDHKECDDVKPFKDLPCDDHEYTEITDKLSSLASTCDVYVIFAKYSLPEEVTKAKRHLGQVKIRNCSKLVRELGFHAKQLRTVINSEREKLEEVCRLEKKVELYMLLENTAVKVEKYEKKVSEVELAYHHINEELSTELHRRTKLGQELSKTFPMKLVGDVRVKTINDTQNCWITGLAVIYGKESRIIVADRSNSRLKLFDIGGKLLSNLDLEYAPTSMIRLDPDTVAIAGWQSKSIKLIKIKEDNTINLDSSYLMERIVTGLAGKEGKLAILMQSNPGNREPNTIEIIDTTESIIVNKPKYFRTRNWQILFDEPADIAFSPDRKSLYVIDQELRDITQFSLDGKVLRKTQFSALYQPIKLTVDKFGLLFVTCTYYIHVLKSDLSEITQVHFDEFQIRLLYATMYDPKSDRMYITSQSEDYRFCNSVKVYQLPELYCRKIPLESKYETECSGSSSADFEQGRVSSVDSECDTNGSLEFRNGQNSSAQSRAELAQFRVMVILCIAITVISIVLGWFHIYR